MALTRIVGATKRRRHYADVEPFDLATAKRAGLTRAQLLSSRWRRLGPQVYVSRDVVDDPVVRLKAAVLRLPMDAAFSGRTAAFLHGLDSQCHVIEATLPAPTRISRRAGITIRRRRLAPDEVVIRKGFSGDVGAPHRSGPRIAPRPGRGRGRAGHGAAQEVDSARPSSIAWRARRTRERESDGDTTSHAVGVGGTPAPKGADSRFMTSTVGSWAGPISTTPNGAWSSSTTEPLTAIASPPTTGARTAWSTRAIASSASPLGTCWAHRTRCSTWSGEPI